MENKLVAFDLETTGIDIQNDHIVEISFEIISENWNSENKTYRINPRIPIQSTATEVHGITSEAVKDCPSFSECAEGFYGIISGATRIGYDIEGPKRFSDLTDVCTNEGIRTDNLRRLEKGRLSIPIS